MNTVIFATPLFKSENAAGLQQDLNFTFFAKIVMRKSLANRGGNFGNKYESF